MGGFAFARRASKSPGPGKIALAKAGQHPRLNARLQTDGQRWTVPASYSPETRWGHSSRVSPREVVPDAERGEERRHLAIVGQRCIDASLDANDAMPAAVQ